MPSWSYPMFLNDEPPKPKLAIPNHDPRRRKNGDIITYMGYCKIPPKDIEPCLYVEKARQRVPKYAIPSRCAYLYAPLTPEELKEMEEHLTNITERLGLDGDLSTQHRNIIMLGQIIHDRLEELIMMPPWSMVKDERQVKPADALGEGVIRQGVGDEVFHGGGKIIYEGLVH